MFSLIPHLHSHFEIFLDDSFAEFLSILTAFKLKYKLDKVRMEVGYGFSKYFTLDEMIKTDIKELIISNKNFVLDSNYPQRLQSLKDLCQKILDKLQAHIYKQYGENKAYKLNINSAVRCFELNKKVGGSSNSQHLHCEAADLAFSEQNPSNNKKLLINLYKDLYHKKVDALSNTDLISQCIIEKHNNYWIHIGIKTQRYGLHKRTQFMISPKPSNNKRQYILYKGKDSEFNIGGF
ncbi:hypothetical protein DMC01_09205 [Campylobacter troglodytis]|nr:hypothetical protein DMC01_09205 [Campylobacter troglodytis]